MSRGRASTNQTFFAGEPTTVQFSIVHAQNSSRDSQAIQLVRQICVSFAGNYLRTTLLELLFCFSVLPPLFLSILAAKCPRIVFFRKVFLSCYQLRKFCLFCGEHIFPALILPIVIVVLKVKNEIRGQRYAEVLLEINWML